MAVAKYSVNQHPIQTVLTWIRSGEVAVPEIQRPFVWTPTKVRDFIDSLYQGYPVGYLIAWRNPTVRLKDGTSSQGKRILIDGQQRVTALLAAFLGQRVITKRYSRVRIRIAFHPADGKFEVSNAAIRKDKVWLSDIADVLDPEIKVLRLVDEYCEKNPEADRDTIYERVEQLRGIVNNHIGLIELNSDLDIEAVTQIFVRINREGVPLGQADFAMSKIAVNEKFGGSRLRKCIDYFCHLAVAPEFYEQLADRDKDFASTDYFQKMAWLRQENDDLYDPSYIDMLRVAFTSEFKRGRLEDLVALLSGRNFEMRTYEESIAEESFRRLEHGIFNFMNETHFKRFVMIIRSAGFVASSMIRSQNTLNFAYVVYLVLRAQGEEAGRIESLVRRWFVMSVLTGRYSASPETAFDVDVRQISRIGVEDCLRNIEQADLSDAFWEAGLPQQMNTSVASSPYFNAYMAAQVKMNDRGFLSRDIAVGDLITHVGDVHHVFARDYLKGFGLTRARYNQIANYVMMQSEINIAIGNKPPAEYFSKLRESCQRGQSVYGAISDLGELEANLASHCIPSSIEKMAVEDYDDFLEKRRRLMARKMRKYYAML